jgi:pimeloyl-ACP methyl ester carboxylesterase
VKTGFLERSMRYFLRLIRHVDLDLPRGVVGLDGRREGRFDLHLIGVPSRSITFRRAPINGDWPCRGAARAGLDPSENSRSLSEPPGPQWTRRGKRLICASAGQTPVDQARCAGCVPNVEVVGLDCGHWIQQEKPEETSQAMLKWLDQRQAT